MSVCIKRTCFLPALAAVSLFSALSSISSTLRLGALNFATFNNLIGFESCLGLNLFYHCTLLFSDRFPLMILTVKHAVGDFIVLNF